MAGAVKEGYPVEVAYTAGFYPETAPAWLAFAGLVAAGEAGRAARPARVLELGFGQGFGLALLAAANPDTAFEGCDFNPAHVAHARGWADAAGLENLQVSAASFQDMAERPGEADVDVIVAHGVMSWIAPQARDALVQVVRSRLLPGGRLHLSYNCSPGAVPDAPLRDLFQAVAARTPASPQAQVQAALELIRTLRDGGASYLVHNPVAAAHVEAMLQADPIYLAHEYLGEHWRIFKIAQMADLLAPAGLRYLCSATPADNIAACAAPAALQPLLAKADDIVWREALSDLAANRAFRRDIFARQGASHATPGDAAGLDGWRFVLIVPGGEAGFTFQGPMGALEGTPRLYQPLAQRLAGGPVAFAELIALPAFAGGPALLTECLAFLVGSGQAAAIPPGPGPDPSPAQRFNRIVIERAKAGAFHTALASPVTRSGVPVGELDLMACAATLDGASGRADTADYVLNLLKEQGRSTLDGIGVAAGVCGRSQLESRLATTLGPRLELWRRMEVLA